MNQAAAATPRTAPISLVVAVRLTLLAAVAGMTVVATRDPAQLGWLAPLAVAAGWAVQAGGHRWLGPAGRLAEVIAVGVAASAVAVAADSAGTLTGGFGALAVLPYLVGVVGLVALRRRPREAYALLAVAAVTLAVAGASTPVAGGRQLTQTGYLAAGLTWLLLAGIGIAATAALQRVVLARVAPPQPYAEATRLLTQLRSVARQLPGATLDPGGIAEHLLEEVDRKSVV